MRARSLAFTLAHTCARSRAYARARGVDVFFLFYVRSRCAKNSLAGRLCGVPFSLALTRSRSDSCAAAALWRTRGALSLSLSLALLLRVRVPRSVRAETRAAAPVIFLCGASPNSVVGPLEHRASGGVRSGSRNARARAFRSCARAHARPQGRTPSSRRTAATTLRRCAPKKTFEKNAPPQRQKGRNGKPAHKFRAARELSGVASERARLVFFWPSGAGRWFGRRALKRSSGQRRRRRRRRLVATDRARAESESAETANTQRPLDVVVVVVVVVAGVGFFVCVVPCVCVCECCS